jgi:hypothetical protein
MKAILTLIPRLIAKFFGELFKSKDQHNIPNCDGKFVSFSSYDGKRCNKCGAKRF